jgi:hypothetical protein
LYFYHFSTIF